MALFTPEELKELQRADAELDEDFRQTQEEIEESRRRDRAAVLDRKDNHSRKIAAQQAAWKKRNRNKWNAYMREYRRKKKEAV